MDRKDLNQRLGFRYVYRQVLEDLRSRSLTPDCYERKLEDAMLSGFEMLESNRIELLNDSDEALDAEDDIKIVDMHMVIGAPIDRKKGDSLKLEIVKLPKIA